MDWRTRWPSYFAHSTNYLIDTDITVIMDVEATRPIPQADVRAVRTVIDTVQEKHDFMPERLTADTACRSSPMLDWLVEKRGIALASPVVRFVH